MNIALVLWPFAVIAAVTLIVIMTEPYRGDFAPARRDAGGEASEGSMAVEPPAEWTVTGRLLFPSGRVAQGARVELIDAEGECIASAEVARDGTYRVAGPPDRIAGVLASAQGFPSAVARVRPGSGSRGASASVDVVLPPGVAIAMRAVDDEGSAIPGALVFADPMDPGLGEGERRALARADAGRTDEWGEAVVTARASIAIELVADAPRHVAARSDPLTPPIADPVVLELPRAGRLAGVATGPLGVPAAGARVRVVGSGLWPAAEFVADAAGRFATGLIQPGFYEVEAVWGEFVAPIQRGVEVAPAADRRVSLVLQPGGRLAGRLIVRDDGPGPEIGAVTIHAPGVRLVPIRATPDSDGAFSAGPLVPGRYLLRAGAPGFLGAETWAEVVAGETTTADLVLRRGRTLAGRVVDRRGDPVRGAEVTVAGGADAFVFRSPITEAIAGIGFAPGSGGARLLPIGELGVMEGPLPPIPPLPFAWLDGDVARDRGAPAGPGDAGRTANPLVTDNQGRFVCDALPEGRFVVSVVHPAFAPAAIEATVAAEDPRTVVTVTLDPGCSLTGTIRDERSAPVHGAVVWVAAGARFPPKVLRAGEDGGYRADHLPASVRMRVLARGFAAAEIRVDLDGTPCVATADVTLASLAGRVTGRVIDSRRYPVAGADVRLGGTGGSARWPGQDVVTDEEGAFAASAPAGGELSVTVSHPDYLDAVATGAAGDAFEIVLHRGVRMVGTLQDDTGVPIAGTVTVSRDGRVVAARITAAEAGGAFDAGRVAPGAYEVHAAAQGYADATLLVGVDDPPDAGPESVVRVDLRMRRGVVLAGRAVDRFDGAVSDAAIRVYAARSTAPAAETRSDSDGRFEIAGLPPGRYRVEAERDDLGVASGEATLDLGAVGRPIEVRFRKAAAPESEMLPESTGRIAYSVINDAVIVSRPPGYAAPGTDALLTGDRIIRVEMTPVGDTETLRGVLSRMRRQTVSVAIERSGRRRFLSVDRRSMIADGW